MSYTSLERSKLYVNYAFNSLLSYSISKQIYTKLRSTSDEISIDKGINRPSRRSCNYFEIMQKSYFDVINYSAFAIESFINKLGFCVYGNDYSTKIIFKGKTLERCSIKIKIQELIHEINKSVFDYDAKGNQLVKNLFINRDDLVHDKPEITDGLNFFYKKKNEIVNITPDEAFKALLIVNDLFTGYKYKDSPVHFISDNVENKYSLLIKDNELIVDEGLPFCEASFSDVLLYRLYIRNTLGFEIDVELKENRITKKMA